MAKKTTLSDVARVAKVSPATVSRVVAGLGTVDPKLRARVRKTAEKLGIDLEKRRKSPRIVAFLLANRDLLHNFHARVLMGAEAYCAQHNWELLFTSFRYTPDVPAHALHLPQLLGNEPNPRGVIVSGCNYANLLAALQDRGMPFVVLGNNVIGDWKPELCDVAFSDDVTGVCEATRHLIARGHRRIGYIGNRELPWYQRAETGYLRAMADAGLKPNACDFRSEGNQLGYLGTKAILLRHPVPTAIIAGTDPAAAGVYKALHELRLRVPDDISVVGVNDSHGASLTPALTSVRAFPEELGRHMAQFLLHRMTSPQASPQHLTFPTELVQRDSVAAPANRPLGSKPESRVTQPVS